MTIVYGSVANSCWRAKLEYTTSSNATTYTIDTTSSINRTNCQSIDTGDGIDTFGSIVLSIAATGKTTQRSTYSGPSSSETSAILYETFTWSKTHAVQNVRLTSTVNVKNCEAWNGSSHPKITGTSTAYGPSSSTYIQIPAKTSYSVTYNANGGTGAPGTQTKWYNETLTLSTTVPTRSGWTFVGWAKSSTATSAAYAAGASYTTNAALALYAVWKKTITVSYNANGGTSAPSSQSVTIYNSTTSGSIKLTTAKPTRSNFAFVGWAASSSATSSSYSPGSTYSFSGNTPLYAVWDAVPLISSLTVVRSDANGDPADEGTYAKVTCNWYIDGALGDTATLSGTITPQSGGSARSFSFSSGGSGSGTKTATALLGSLDTDMQYTVTVTAANGTRTATRNAILTRAFFVMDWKAGGQAIGIGRAAPASGLEVGYNTTFDSNATVLGGFITVGHNADNRGSIRFQSSKRTGEAIKFYGNSENDYGDEIVIGDGGQTIIGSGESAINLHNALAANSGAEQMYITSDGAIYLYSHADTIANRTQLMLGNYGYPGLYGRCAADHAVNIDTSANNGATASTDIGVLHFQDKNAYWAGSLGSEIYGSAGKVRTYIGARNMKTDGTNVTNYLCIDVDKDGTQGYSVSSPANFRSAIGAVNKAGDTMTGDLTLDDGKYKSTFSQNTRRGSAAPSSAVYGSGQYAYDSNGDNIYYSEICKTTGNEVYRSFAVRRLDSSGANPVVNGFYLRIDDSGNPTVTFTTGGAAAWRNGMSAAAKTWTQIKTWSGTAQQSWSMGSYSEFLIVARYSTSFVGSALLPAAHITSTAREVYVSGGYNGTGVQGRGFALTLSSTTAKAIIAIVDGTDRLSSTSWWIYGR